MKVNWYHFFLLILIVGGGESDLWFDSEAPRTQPAVEKVFFSFVHDIYISIEIIKKFACFLNYFNGVHDINNKILADKIGETTTSELFSFKF
jgi:hypothetical protein